MEKEGPFETPLFHTSARALRERTLLFNSLRALVCLVLCVIALALAGDDATRLTIALGVAGALSLAVFLLPTQQLFAPFAARELRLMEGALEERRGRYARFLTYDQIAQLRVERSTKEEIRAVIVIAEQGSLTLRGYEPMEQLFAELAARRPAQALIEIEDSAYDKGSPLIWAALAVLSGFFCLIILRAL